jgi:hypothetical protein
MSYEFVAHMVHTCGPTWDRPYLLGWLHSNVRLYLLGAIPREKFTAVVACYELAEDRFHSLVVEHASSEKAVLQLLKELNVEVPDYPQARGHDRGRAAALPAVSSPPPGESAPR